VCIGKLVSSWLHWLRVNVETVSGSLSGAQRTGLYRKYTPRRTTRHTLSGAPDWDGAGNPRHGRAARFPTAATSRSPLSSLRPAASVGLARSDLDHVRVGRLVEPRRLLHLAHLLPQLGDERGDDGLVALVGLLVDIERLGSREEVVCRIGARARPREVRRFGQRERGRALRVEGRRGTPPPLLRKSVLRVGPIGALPGVPAAGGSIGTLSGGV
jgi:hypothetical protein